PELREGLYKELKSLSEHPLADLSAMAAQTINVYLRELAEELSVTDMGMSICSK
ncbi:hypothetical protein SARC_12892, partial [Sphaeroforma arctica JP610]